MIKQLLAKKPIRWIAALVSVVILILLIYVVVKTIRGGWNLPGGSQVTPSMDETQAYATVYAELTQAVALTHIPSLTYTPTGSGISTQTPSSAPTAIITVFPTTPAAPPPTSVAGCDLAAPGIPIDVTIPDDTQMAPGQSFTKTWRLTNVGTCTWTRSYTLAFFSGEPMGAPPAGVPLSKDVPPGQSVDVSVDLTAPLAQGSYQGNWKLRNPSGGYFGIGPTGDAPFWLRIVVVQSITASPTTGAATSTASPTPVVLASGELVVIPGNHINLNTAQVVVDGGDIAYETGSDGRHLLNAIGTVLMGVFGTSQPTFDDCHSAAPSATSLAVEDLPAGTYLCYRTSLGLPGRALIKGFNAGDGSLLLELATWSVP